jgi:acyl-CoA hydrolase
MHGARSLIRRLGTGRGKTATRSAGTGAAQTRLSKSARKSWTYMSEVLGNPGLAGRNVRLQAGELLKVIDLCAASSAMQHAGHPTCPTLAFDRVELLVPCCHGDLVHMDSRVVAVGNSTMVIQVLGRKRDVLSRQWVYTHEAFATFVSLGADRRPALVPDLEVETEEEKMMRAYILSRQQEMKIYQEEQRHRELTSTMPPEEVEAISTKHRDSITMEESTIRLRKNFLPRNLNGIGTIFGGDLLAWMESAAVLCASNFTRNSNVVTIAMDRVFFKTAIQVDHVLELTARVVYCRKHTLQVETTVTAILPGWSSGVSGSAAVDPARKADKTFSHTGYFTILNMTDYGHKKPLGVALDIRDDADAQAACLKAEHRVRFSQSAVMTDPAVLSAVRHLR